MVTKRMQEVRGQGSGGEIKQGNQNGSCKDVCGGEK